MTGVLRNFSITKKGERYASFQICKQFYWHISQILKTGSEYGKNKNKFKRYDNFIFFIVVFHHDNFWRKKFIN